MAEMLAGNLPPRRLRRVGGPRHDGSMSAGYTQLPDVAVQGRIVKVFYPVFPPDRDASAVLAWLRGAALDAGPRMEDKRRREALR